MLEAATFALVVATTVLVGVTGYYALQTRNMVDEMKAARKATVRPKVVAAYESYGGGIGFPRVVNVGAGPALDVDVKLSWEPGHANEVRWRTPILMPGEFREFVPHGLGAEYADISKLTATYSSVDLRGTCRDTLGDSHAVAESFDLREWWQLAVLANEKIERGQKSPVVKALEKIAEAINK